MVTVSDYFDVQYGVNLELNKLEIDQNGIPFVSRTSKNNGVSAYVKKLPGVPPIPGGVITVAAGGSVMESFLQPREFYSGRDVYYLTPKIPMSNVEKLFYCVCLRKNKFRFSYGRQANRTLGDLLIPSIEEIPAWVRNFDFNSFAQDLLPNLDMEYEPKTMLEGDDILLTRLDDLFDIYNGIASSSVKRYPAPLSDEYIPYIRPSKTQFSSIDAYVNKAEVDRKYIFPKGTLYVSTDGQGSHTYAYVSVGEFVPNSNVAVLMPKRKMGIQEKLFYAYCISMNRFKFSYGRKPKGDKLRSILVPSYLPSFISKDFISEILSEWKSRIV